MTDPSSPCVQVASDLLPEPAELGMAERAKESRCSLKGSVVGTLANTVCEVARNVYLDPPVESDGDDCARLGEFVLERDDDALCVYRITNIPGAQSADPVRAPIPCGSVNAEARAAIALLRAWVNQSLDFAELGMLQHEDNQ